MTLEEAMAEAPLVAIIRGVRPDEVSAHARALFEAGFRIVEVPLNSPDPVRSVGILAREWGDQMVCGAGTVLSPAQVDAVGDAGGQIVVSPDTRPEVIVRTVQRGLTPMPGFATATEMLRACDAGARHLKLFPASSYGQGHIKALMAVAPRDAVILAVGGAGADNLKSWWDAGARGFGLGSELYRPGQAPEDTLARARRAMEAWRQIAAGAAAA